ncbi:Hypothetical predicted protein [Paramuricea clavata]|uniref:Uncharacterized protein n=1 Tax=Paramuricea clavata TaxID=317549 RepID=A0A6S7GUH4_PARCT|nr:Hypothetical predicted protein [Paramuricea clavata]
MAMKRYSICFLLLAALDAIMTDNELELTTVVEARENNTEMMIDNDRPVENMLIGKSKRGPNVHPIWSYAFDDPTAYTITGPNNAICKHCKQSVRHHHKMASVKNHLRKCFQFKKVMLEDTTVSDRPDWWTDQRGTAKKSMGSTSSKSTSSVTSKSQSSVRSFSIPLFSASEQKRFNHEMAMYFYCTGTSFQRAEDPFLLRAIQLARPDAKLPTCKQLADDGAGGLLDECYQNVKEEVNKVLSTDGQFVCLTSDAWSNVVNDPVVDYTAVSPTKSWKWYTQKSKAMMQTGFPQTLVISLIVSVTMWLVQLPITQQPTRRHGVNWRKDTPHIFMGVCPWSSSSCERYLCCQKEGCLRRWSC